MFFSSGASLVVFLTVKSFGVKADIRKQFRLRPARSPWIFDLTRHGLLSRTGQLAPYL